MKITVCELPHGADALERAWAALCAHTRQQRSELVVLPEFAFVEPVWTSDRFDAARWSSAESACGDWLRRLGELGADHVVGTRPVTDGGRHYNEGYIASAGQAVMPLRRKRWLPDEPGGREARWFDAGDAAFGAHAAGPLSFGLNICTELWALDTYAAYAALGIHAIVSPRATAAATTAKWLAVGTVAAVRSGAFSVSSNRVEPDGACGGVGWIIDPDGALLARTSAATPFCTVDMDLRRAAQARRTYPRYVFARPPA